MQSVPVKFRKVATDAILPKRATSGAACYDAYLGHTHPPLMPGECRAIPLGFQVEVPEGYELQVRARSGLASKGVIMANGVGTIDSDYRGEVGAILINLSGMIMPLNKGDRICQLKISEAKTIDWEIVDEIGNTERGEGGYGSSGGHEWVNPGASSTGTTESVSPSA